LSPETTLLTQALVSGLLIGFVFSLISVGLTLIFGVMDIVNFAHGEYLMLAMYFAYWAYTWWHLDPLVSMLPVTLLLFILGIITYRLVIRYVLDAPMLAQIFVTFGLMILLRNLAQLLWTEDYRRLGETLISGRLEVAGIFIGTPQLVASVGSAITTGLLYWFIKNTRTGWALEATAENKEVAALMGINTERMFALAWGLGAACVGVAGVLLATFNPIFPEVGTVFVLVAYVAVALGGFGSITGAFVAGIIIGLVQVLGGFLWEPRFKTVLVYAIYLGVVFIRPQGLFGRR